MSMKTYHDAMQHFEAPNIENDKGRLNEKQITQQQAFTKRSNEAYAWIKMNGFPENYQAKAEFYKEYCERNNAAGAINLEDLYALDRAISRTIYDVDTFIKLGIPKSTMTKPRWELKDYLVKTTEWPVFTRNFTNPHFVSMNESSQFTNGIGLNLGISIPFTEIIESKGALWSPESIMTQERATKFGIQKSRRGFLGVLCEDAAMDDGMSGANAAITGLFNYGSNQTFEAGPSGVADDDVTTQGDMEATVRIAMTDLKQVHQPGKYLIVSSSGVASEMFLHRDSGAAVALDSKRVKEIMSIVTDNMRNGSWGGWFVSEQLLNVAASASTQSMMIMKVGPALMHQTLVYPTQTLPMLNKKYEKDIQNNMIFGDILQIKKIDTSINAVPISIAASITATTTGFIPEGVRIL